MTVGNMNETISALAKVVEANSGMMGSDSTSRMANDKIKELIEQLPKYI